MKCDRPIQKSEICLSFLRKYHRLLGLYPLNYCAGVHRVTEYRPSCKPRRWRHACCLGDNSVRPVCRNTHTHTHRQKIAGLLLLAQIANLVGCPFVTDQTLFMQVGVVQFICLFGTNEKQRWGLYYKNNKHISRPAACHS